MRNFRLLFVFPVVFPAVFVLAICSYCSWCDGQQGSSSTLRAAKKGNEDQRYRIKKDIRQLLDEAIIPAVKNDCHTEFFEPFQLIVKGSDARQLEEIERYCAEEAAFSFKQLYIDELLLRIQEGQVSGSIKVPYEHALYIASGLTDRVNRELTEIRAFAFFDPNFKLPENWREAELLFWDSHVVNNRLHNVKAIANVALQTVMPHHDKYKQNDRLNRLPELLPFFEVPERIVAEYFQFKGNEAAHHLHQLRYAANRLKVSVDFEDRLYAAYAIHDAKNKLDEYFLETPADRIHHPEFRDPQFKNELVALINQAHQDGQDVIEKAVLLRVGTHWWLRGRYGMGPLANGLLKVPEAVKDERIMFGLYMPKRPDKPISMYFSDEDSIKGYDRRHYYTWAVEYRPRYSGTSRNFESSPVGPPVILSLDSHFW